MILSARVDLLPLVHHLIGNGRSTFFWLDPWLPYGRLTDRFGTNAVFKLGLSLNILVGTFIGNGNWVLPITSSPDLIDIFTLIKATPALSATFADELILEGF